MAGYACKWCDYTPLDEEEDLTNSEKFTRLTAHQREEHPDEMRSRMTGAKAAKANQKQPVGSNGTGNSTSDFRDGDVKVRLSNEQITLPGELFVLYNYVKMQFPDYERTKAEWLEEVVATWAIDHGEEINLPSIPGWFINNTLDSETYEEDEFDEEEENAQEIASPVVNWYSEGQQGGGFGF